MSFDELIATAASVGVALEIVQPERRAAADLYVWITPTGEVLYIGRQLSPNRLADELGWVADIDPRAELSCGFISLVQQNGGQPVPLRLISFDAEPAFERIRLDRWLGVAIEALTARLSAGPLTVSDVEKLLVRICVHVGAPVGNSQFAGQWESQLGKPVDTLAILAASSLSAACP